MAIPANEWLIYEDVKYWTWTTGKQIDRLRQSFRAKMISLQADISDGPSGATLASSIQQQRLNAQTSADVHMLIVVANHLITALRRRLVPAEVRQEALPKSMEDAIEGLRDILEHWDRTRQSFSTDLPKPSAAKSYLDRHPDKTPWSLSYSNVQGLVVCGILNVEELAERVERIERAIERIQEATSPNKSNS